jgi:hypothetical protein
MSDVWLCCLIGWLTIISPPKHNHIKSGCKIATIDLQNTTTTSLQWERPCWMAYGTGTVPQCTSSHHLHLTLPWEGEPVPDRFMNLAPALLSLAINRLSITGPWDPLASTRKLVVTGVAALRPCTAFRPEGKYLLYYRIEERWLKDDRAPSNCTIANLSMDDWKFQFMINCCMGW